MSKKLRGNKAEEKDGEKEEQANFSAKSVGEKTQFKVESIVESINNNVKKGTYVKRFV